MFVINLCFVEVLFISAPVCTTNLVLMSKIWLVFADVLYQVLTSKKVDHIFSKSKLLNQNSISNYEIIKRTHKKTVLGI